VLSIQGQGQVKVKVMTLANDSPAWI